MQSQFWISTSPDNDDPGFYLLPCELERPTGSSKIRSLSGETAFVDSEWVKAFAVSRSQAVKLARSELGKTLDELRTVIDEELLELRGRLSRVHDPVPTDSSLSHRALPTVGDLITSLPKIILGSLSSDVERVAASRAAMRKLHTQLNDAGLRVDERFLAFPDRLAKLREDFDRERAERKSR